MGVEHAPDVDVIIALDVEDKVRITLQHAAAQPREGKLMRVARRSGGGMIGNHAVRDPQRFNETQGDVGPGFAKVVVNGRFDVPTRQLPRQDRLFAHLLLA